MKPLVLTLENINVRYRGRDILRDLSLDIHAGEFMALLGANGSGKTTFLKTAMGFVRPASGRVSLFGEATTNFRRLRRRIGYVPQYSAIDFKMPISVFDVVSMGRFGAAGIGRRLGADDYDIIAKTIDETGISHLSDRPIGHLSGGELQKVHIARALCKIPELLLLDEPTNSLDLGAQRECLDLIARLHREHKLTTVIVMHDLKSLPRECSRAVIIDDCSTVYDGPMEDIYTEVNLAHIYKHQARSVLNELLADIPGRKKKV